MGKRCLVIAAPVQSSAELVKHTNWSNGLRYHNFDAFMNSTSGQVRPCLNVVSLSLFGKQSAHVHRTLYIMALPTIVYGYTPPLTVGRSAEECFHCSRPCPV